MGKILYVSFFFQAEDGIRGLYVTGVQTVLFRSRWWKDVDQCHAAGADSVEQGLADGGLALRRRSEERRVGKECSSRWGRSHLRNEVGVVMGTVYHRHACRHRSRCTGYERRVLS